MPLYQEATRYRDAIVLGGLLAAILALLSGASAYFWTATVSGEYALVYLGLAGLLTFVFARLRRARYRLKVTAKAIKVKLNSARRVRKRIPLAEVTDVVPVRRTRALRYADSNAFGLDHFYSLAGHVGVVVRARGNREYFVGCSEPERVARIVRQAKQTLA